MRLRLALVAALSMGSPTVAAEISDSDCAAIRSLVQEFAEANLANLKSLDAVDKEVMKVMTIDNMDELRGIRQAVKVETHDMDRFRTGYQALDRACPTS